jgi:hypothetical protein
VKPSRRDCLRLGALAGAGALLSGCSEPFRRYTAPELPKSVALPPGDVEPVARLLNRIAFGPMPGEAARVASLGRKRYVAEQLRPGQEEPPFLTLRLSGLESLVESAADRRELFTEDEVLGQLQQAAILRAVYSPHQLRERMAEFWSNHFNIYARKGSGAFYKPTDELNVIRAHALGKFPAMLRASARSPAMLTYLDNQANRRGVPNENYARELMELHTLGVHGGYTQKDVQEVARCLTGWTVEDRFLRPPGTFRFDPDRHDDGSKTVLGVSIPAGGGESDGERVLDILAHHPAAARHIAGKLCRHFLGDAESPWAEKLAAIYARTGGDIREMLRPLLLSEEILHSPPLMKRPFDFVVSALRALNADTDGGADVQAHLARMGQPLYLWPMPDGYPDRASAWTGSLLARWNFALELASGRVGGTRVDLPGLARSSGAYADSLIALVFARRADTDALRPLRDRIARRSLEEKAALLLASPEFQWR